MVYGSNWDILVFDAVCHTRPTSHVCGEWCVCHRGWAYSRGARVTGLSAWGVGVFVGGGLSPLVAGMCQGGCRLGGLN